MLCVCVCSCECARHVTPMSSVQAGEVSGVLRPLAGSVRYKSPFFSSLKKKKFCIVSSQSSTFNKLKSSIYNPSVLGRWIAFVHFSGGVRQVLSSPQRRHCPFLCFAHWTKKGVPTPFGPFHVSVFD